MSYWWKQYWLGVWVFLVGVGVGIILGWSLTYEHDHPDRPYCPTEDSCSIDYRDGSWHIEEVTP